MKPVGQTKDGTFQFGLRKTFPQKHKEVWDFMFSKKGLLIWLGEIDLDQLEIKKEFVLSNGLSGKINTFKPYSHIRMVWKNKNWKNDAHLQVRIYPSKEKTVISFAHEKLKDHQQREEVKKHWNDIMDELSHAIS